MTGASLFNGEAVSSAIGRSKPICVNAPTLEGALKTPGEIREPEHYRHNDALIKAKSNRKRNK